MERIRMHAVAFERGEKSGYSNTNYALLSFTVEDVEEMIFSEVLFNKILDPLKLENPTTAISWIPLKEKPIRIEKPVNKSRIELPA